MKNLCKWALVLMFLSGTGYAQQTDSIARPVAFNTADVKWVPAPQLGNGAEMAVLAGNPKESGGFTVRLRFPANYDIKPHRHPGIEHVTVIEGELYAGTGSQFSRDKATLVLKPGGFVAIPPETPHFGYTRGVLILQINGTGPFDIIYVNKEDDPRGSGQKGP
ncbi:MAG TPA: cupin domain-containing protein [Sphingobacteriaceae bacterium]